MELPPELNVLLLWVAVGAFMLFVHALTLRRAVSFAETLMWRIVSVFVPPVAPYVAWRGGAKTLAVLWVLSVAAYIAVRLFGI